METDSDSDFDNRKTKSSQNMNFQMLEECVRPFTLRQQFPSTLSEFHSSKLESEKSVSVAPTSTMKNISGSPLSGKMTFIPNKEVAISSESIKKLKLKLKSGKDLGEVKIIPSTQGGKSPAQLESIERSCTVTSSSRDSSSRPIIKTVRIVDPKSRELIGITDKAPLNSILRGVTDDEKSRTKSVKYRTILPKPIEGKPSSVHNLDSQMQKVFILKPGDNQQKDSLKKIEVKKIGNKKFVILKNDSTSSKYLLEDVEKSSEKILGRLGNSFKGLKRTMIPSQNFISSKKLCLDNNVRTIKNSDSLVELSSDEDHDDHNFPLKYKTLHVPKGNIVIKKVSKESPRPINNEDFLDNESISFDQASESLDEQTIGNSRNNFEVDNSLNSIESEPNSNINNLNGSSDKIDILKKALLSVEDDKLREEALKALNECGIKVKKSIPVKHPPPRKLINETTTQTDVFFLLKEGQFIQVDEKKEGLHKMEYKQKVNSQMFDTMNAKTTINNESMDEFKNKLDKIVDELNCKSTQDIKKAFEERRPLAKILLKQLNLEFERAKNFDQDGFLGIHKAVLNDDVHQIQKNLIILKACKLSIDIETQDCKTSLELAVEFEVNPQIVKILLDAGAQPVSSKLRHDSALILAARKSSKILSLLIKNINKSNRSLINAKDSEGLAAIHYCAQHGNLEGVEKLLSLEVDVNLQDDKSGRTALFYAIESRNTDISQDVYNEIAHKLLEKGAISNIPIFSKHTVLSMIDDVKSHTLKIALNRAVR